MAKQIIQERLSLLLPAWDGELDMVNPPKLYDAASMVHYGRTVEYQGKISNLHSAILEMRREDYIPDVTAQDAEGLLLIEIRVSHAVDDIKRCRIQSEGVRLVEIDLSHLNKFEHYDPEYFENQVLANHLNRVWLSCPAATEAWRESYHELKNTIAARNSEIKQFRAQEELKNQQYKAKMALVEATLNAKSLSREKSRLQFRRRIQTELDALPVLIEDEAIKERLKLFIERDKDQMALVVGAIENPVIRTLLMDFHCDAWIYNQYPILWQAKAYEYFIASRQKGYQFNQCEMANWIRNICGIEKNIYKLFNAQYSDRSKARRDGFNKNKISAWYFSNNENANIPNIYRPVNSLVERLVSIGTIKFVDNGYRIVQVC